MLIGTEVAAVLEFFLGPPPADRAAIDVNRIVEDYLARKPPRR